VDPVVIVGAGMAGYAVARALRQRDASMPLQLITRDAGAVYAKPALSNGFAHGRDARQMISAGGGQAGAGLGIDVRTHVQVHRIDVDARVIAHDGGHIAYSSVVLATGAVPVPLAVAGAGSADVLSINHLDDYSVLRDRLAAGGAGAQVVVIGAGLVGCELADDLLTGGFAVTLVDPRARPLSNLAAPALSDALARALCRRGLDMHMHATCTRVDRAGASLLVTLDSGAVIVADVVIAAIGVRPDLALAQASGLGTARGILVDAFGRTTAPHVYALGDCAEYATHDGTRVLPYIAPMLAAARAIAASLTGTPTRIDLPATPVVVKTPSCALALAPPAAGLDGTYRGARRRCRRHGAWLGHDGADAGPAPGTAG
jgi:rubredoxin-NAD+ reductase